jgi:hypothetical protein
MVRLLNSQWKFDENVCTDYIDFLRKMYTNVYANPTLVPHLSDTEMNGI